MTGSAVYQGRLVRCPFPERPVAATTKPFPLRSTSDFEVAAGFRHDAPSPLLTFKDHFDLLAELVTTAQTLWPALEHVLVRLQLPGTIRLPAALLGERVFVALDLTAEIQALEAAGRDYLAIDDDFRRVLSERAFNGVTLRLRAPEAELVKLAALAAILEAHGVKSL